MRRSASELSEINDIANLAADAARRAILPYFRHVALAHENKMDHGFDPVTEADRAGEDAIRAVLQQTRPDDGILGEEYADKDGTSGLTWVLDPIDGTRGFISGTPTWGVLIALSDADGPLYGLIDQPYIGERFTGSALGAKASGPQGEFALSTRGARPLAEATVFTTFPEVGSAAECEAFHAVAGKAQLTRYGMDCYAYAMLACGQIDLVIEAGLQAYDIQAPIAVVEAAGGLVTDWRGDPVHMGGRAIAAANAEIHAEALAVLQKANL